jgi:hypothetical protein
MRPSQRSRGLPSSLRIVEPAVEQSSAFRKHPARHEQPWLMQRPAICCEPMRFHWLIPTRRTCRCPRAIELRQRTADAPGILARVIGVRRTAISIAAHVFQQARLASYSHGNIEIIDVDGFAEDLVRVRRGAPDATRPGTGCNE